jgi:hypothetical protein
MQNNKDKQVAHLSLMVHQCVHTFLHLGDLVVMDVSEKSSDRQIAW